MDEIRAEDVAAVVSSVAGYGNQLAVVFHNHSLIAEKVSSGFEGAINILDATVATLKQILTLLNDEASASTHINPKTLFSEEGRKYVRLLSVECGTVLAKVELAIDEGCLGREERKALLKKKKKPSYKRSIIAPDPLSLKLDEKEFLEKVEKAKWSWSYGEVEDCIERLYELQLHILLITQVVTVGALSRDVSSGNVDIKSIVTYHERIHRTANLVGIKAPSRRTNNYRRRYSFSSSDSSSSSSGSDSDSSVEIIREKIRGPPPPPPPGPPRVWGPPPPPVLGGPGPGPWSPPKYVCGNSETVIDLLKPPAYSETQKSLENGESTISTSSPLLGTATPATSVNSSSLKDEKSRFGDVSSIDETPVEKEEIAEPEMYMKPKIQEGQLFKSKSTGFGFKFKSFFRSRESLAQEMRQTLNNTETLLTAFIIQRGLERAVPHSAFHSLEATHMKTVLSQLNDDSWYKTFSTLDTFEHNTLNRILNPCVNGEPHTRELVVLKVVQQNRLNAWMVLLNEFLRNQPFPRGTSGRVILAICRQKLVEGKLLPTTASGYSGPPPGRASGPSPPIVHIPVTPNVQHPPLPPGTGRTSRISDLSTPPPLPPPPPPNGWPGPPASRLPPVGPPPKTSIRLSETTPWTDSDAKEVLTTYNEYTVRICEPSTPTEPRTWARVVITQESPERHLIQQRVLQFEARDGNVIETKLRMTEQQSGQVTRIMDEIKSSERDFRFEWCWVELSLHNQNGEITDFISRDSKNCLATATTMHLIAKRTLKLQYKPLDIYNLLMRPGRGPPGSGPGMGPPRPGPGPPPPMSKPIIVMPSPVKKSCRSISSDSDSDDTSWSSDSSEGVVRRKLRRYRAKKEKATLRKKKYSSDSDSDSEEEEDVIKVHVEVKRGDDVVKKLLDLWTPELDTKGKGKATAV